MADLAEKALATVRRHTGKSGSINLFDIKLPAYKTVKKLGSGGMADVFEVESPDGRRFALKVFRREKESSFLQRRFLAEARILKTIYHPRIVRVHDCGIDEDGGSPWFVMDLVLGADGEPMTIEDARRRGGIQDATLRKWFADVKDALAYLHKCGIVHRDIKLENILVDRDGNARLADFGVSRIVDERLKGEIGVESTFVTGETTGTRPVMGTYFYLAPELRGGREATPETDLYALGVAFFRLLTGMWYERGTNALDLLAPFPEFWRKELPILLGVRAKDAKKARRRLVAWAIAAVCAAVAITLIALFSLPSSPFPFPSFQPFNSSTAASAWSLPESFETPRVKALDGTMNLCACPAGSFMMSGIGNDAPPHKVTITRPFWIGQTVVAQEMQGGEVDEFFNRLNLTRGKELPEGYVFRLPTEAELEYALREGGARTFARHEIGGAPNAWGIVTLWTDVQQAVLDRVDGRKGTKTAQESIHYAAEETDPLRTGALFVSRQFPFQRWLMPVRSGFVRICIGPTPTTNRQPL